MQKWVTVREMYGYALDNNLKLLSSFEISGTDDFWKEYRDNSTLYDKLFDRLYSGFRYFDQEPGNDEDLGEITSRFIVDVLAHLTINRKKYEELQRLQNLEDEDYDILGNVNYKREETGQGSDNSTIIQGQRTDTTNSTQGQRVDNTEDKVSPFESSDYENASKTINTKGSELDTEMVVKGQETDTTSRITGDSSTVTIKGKDNAESNAAAIKEHSDTWKKYEYYSYIFASIAKELLLA